MNFGLGIMFLWLGAVCIWFAARGTQATAPWEMYQEVISAIREGT